MSAQLLKLTDPATRSHATIRVDYGFNLFSLVAHDRGEAVELLWAAENFAQGAERPSHSGIPILFPFPGRLKGTTLEFDGRTFQYEAGDGVGNAIHGFVLNRPWRITAAGASHVTGQFHASVDAPELLGKWPADFLIEVDYRLTGNTLLSEIRVVNPGPTRLPFGLGTHPYFRVPLAVKHEPQAAAACRVQAPAAQLWELVNMLPSGKRKDVSTAPLAQGMPFGEMKFDDVFTGLEAPGGWCTTTIHDPATKRTVRMAFDQGFRECVVYNPPHRQAVCLEPYTCCPDTYSLERQGISAGLQILPAGGSWRGRVEISLL